MAVTVLVGCVEPLVWEALNGERYRAVRVLRTDARGEALLSEATLMGASAVVTTREDAEALGPQVSGVKFLIGISTTSFEAVVWHGGQRSKLANPSASAILEKIAFQEG